MILNERLETIMTEDLKQTIVQKLLKLGIFKYYDIDKNEYLFKDTKENKKMANFIRFTMDESKEVLTIHGFSIDSSYKGFGIKTLKTILDELDASWLVQIENNLNPSFWQHIHDKYFKDYKFVSVEKGHVY